MFFAAFVIVFLVLWAILTFALPPLWRVMRSMANHAAATSMRYGVVQRVMKAAGPLRDYLPVAIILAVGGIVVALAGDGFLDLAELVHRQSPELNAFDARVHDWAVLQRNSGATLFFDAMSIIGGPPGLGIIVLAVAGVIAWKRRFTWLIYLAVTVIGGGVLDLQLKLYFARARPAVAQQLMHATGYSFPSGHAMGSTVAFAALSYLAFRALSEWWQGAGAVSLATTMILSVALSRVYLGVHWISDVTAGIVGGILWVTVATVAYETLRRIHAMRALRRKEAATAIAET